jgi:hypothetical protein
MYMITYMRTTQGGGECNGEEENGFMRPRLMYIPSLGAWSLISGIPISFSNVFNLLHCS